MRGYIYKITNLVNGKIYVGQTKGSIENRFQEHSRAKSLIGNAIRKYGKDNFTIEVIENVTDYSLIDEREIYWIDFYKSTLEGYNISIGGQGVHGYQHTDETKKIIADCSSGRVRIHKDGIDKLVKCDELNSFLENGWSTGWEKSTPHKWSLESRDRVSISQRGRKPFTNGEIEVHILPEQIDDYVSRGYFPGVIRDGEIIVPICVTNGRETKSTTSSKLSYYTDRKWVVGKLEDFNLEDRDIIFNDFETHRRDVIEDRKKKFSVARTGHSVSNSTREKLRTYAKNQVHTKESNLKISMALKGRKRSPMSEDSKKLLSLKNKGKIIVNNGERETSIQISELEYYISNGYVRGHIKSNQNWSDTVWMNDGVKNKRVEISLMEEYLNKGYTKGRIKK